MNELDRALIKELQKDPRQTNKHLAVSLGITENTARRRIDHLVSSGNLIFTVLPDLRKLGFPIRAYIFLHVDHLKIGEVSEQLCKIPCLRFVSHCIGFADLYARGDFSSLESMSDFILDNLGKINGISRVETKLVCKELRREYSYIMTTPPEFQTINSVIEQVDVNLIRQLQKNARSTLKELAQQTRLSDATVHRHIKELVYSGIIAFRAIPSERIIGYSAESFISIQTELDKTHTVAEEMKKYPQVRYLGYISGPIQLLAGIHASSTENLSEFVTKELIKIKGIIGIETISFLKVLKQTFTWI
jgi:Lrp/AsnC family transcriptional regulator for asnA, asnC and gidA